MQVSVVSPAEGGTSWITSKVWALEKKEASAATTVPGCHLLVAWGLEGTGQNEQRAEHHSLFSIWSSGFFNKWRWWSLLPWFSFIETGEMYKEDKYLYI